MTSFDRFALHDPVGAGIELAHQAMRDARHERYGKAWPIDGTRTAALAVLSEGLAAWTHSPALDEVWPQILDAAEQYLCEVARQH